MDPILIRDSSSDAIFVVTKYRKDNKGNLVTDEKFDVTDQFNALKESASD